MFIFDNTYFEQSYDMEDLALPAAVFNNNGNARPVHAQPYDPYQGTPLQPDTTAQIDTAGVSGFPTDTAWIHLPEGPTQDNDLNNQEALSHHSGDTTEWENFLNELAWSDEASEAAAEHEASEAGDEHEPSPQELMADLRENSTPLDSLPRDHIPDFAPVGGFPIRASDWEREQELTNDIARTMVLSPAECIFCFDTSTPTREEGILVRLAELLTHCHLISLQPNVLPASRFNWDQTVRIWTYCIHLRTRTHGEPREPWPIEELARENCDNEHKYLCHKIAKAMMQNYERYYEQHRRSQRITDVMDWAIEPIPSIIRRSIYMRALADYQARIEAEEQAQESGNAHARVIIFDHVDWVYREVDPDWWL